MSASVGFLTRIILALIVTFGRAFGQIKSAMPYITKQGTFYQPIKTIMQRHHTRNHVEKSCECQQVSDFLYIFFGTDCDLW